jgi:hypothetical protein
MNDETIEFAMYVTGNDRESMEQMYDDWRRNQVSKRNEEFRMRIL